MAKKSEVKKNKETQKMISDDLENDVFRHVTKEKTLSHAIVIRGGKIYGQKLKTGQKLTDKGFIRELISQQREDGIDLPNTLAFEFVYI